MSEALSNPEFESLLLRALAPVDPPERLSERLEQTLTDLTDLAAEELDAWEISSMKDPRNWVRPVVAAGVGASAGTALVLLRVRTKSKRRRQQSTDIFDLAERTLRDVADEARNLLDR
ncbi:MAG: hypothetical protein QOH62_698 [Solirubrobacteraceae bacterium]|jgi:hypothetical protein|nr:hypothetical protein [Solirubrobacteraceae bacterium]